jgi:hypothetical protein
MMILKYLGYAISAILAVSSVIFFITSIYVSLKYTKMLKHTKKSIRLGIRYSLLSIFAFGLGLWVFITVESGFSWNSSVTVAGLVGVLCFMVLANAFVNSFFVAKQDDEEH